MSGIDPNEGLKARNDLLWIVDHWTRLRAALVGSGGNALTGMPGATSAGGQSVIDLGVSDLIEEITQQARFYGQALLFEVEPMHGCNDECYREGIPVDECPDIQRPVTTSFMPGLLRDVASRYGHFTASDDKTALEFCDFAHEARDKVRKVIEPNPPMYAGPCQHKGEDGAGCVGKLYVHWKADGGMTDSGTCRQCGTPFTLAEHRVWLEGEFEARLMTMSEIVSALLVLGEETPVGTVKSWISRGKLPAFRWMIGPETWEQATLPALYRLADAQVLIEARRQVA